MVILKLRPSDDPNTPLPLQHGDKITLEIDEEVVIEIEKVEKMDVQMNTPIMSTAPTMSSCWDPETVKPASDDVDMSIASLVLMAAIAHKDMWSYVQTLPSLFEKGGLFYLQVKNGLGLRDGKHVVLPALPDKTFRYCAINDRLELCLEPVGHFAVEPNIESKITKLSTNTLSSSSYNFLMIGGSGAVKNTDRKPDYSFSGQGHKLVSDSPKTDPDTKTKHTSNPDKSEYFLRKLCTDLKSKIKDSMGGKNESKTTKPRTNTDVTNDDFVEKIFGSYYSDKAEFYGDDPNSDCEMEELDFVEDHFSQGNAQLNDDFSQGNAQSTQDDGNLLNLGFGLDRTNDLRNIPVDRFAKFDKIDKLLNTCTEKTVSQSGLEDDDNMSDGGKMGDEQKSSSAVEYRKLGPGYSVLRTPSPPKKIVPRTSQTKMKLQNSEDYDNEEKDIDESESSWDS